MTEKKIDVYKLPVHPAADAFRMLTTEELKELSDSIKEIGLQDPIIIAEVERNENEKEWVIIDGRNRREACKMAGVKSPTYQKLNGVKVEDFVIAKNIHRRHLTKGQQAMAIAMMYPKSKMGRRADDVGKKCAESADISKRRLEVARQVLRASMGEAAEVVSGKSTLDEALAKITKETAEEKRNRQRREEIEQYASDLFTELVSEERNLESAWGEWESRKQQRKWNIDALRRSVERAKVFSTAFQSQSTQDVLREFLDDPKKEEFADVLNQFESDVDIAEYLGLIFKSISDSLSQWSSIIEEINHE